MEAEIVPKPEVKRRCKVCSAADPAWEPDWWGVVSPTGIEHIADERGDTMCGHDATPDGWWWPA